WAEAVRGAEGCRAVRSGRPRGGWLRASRRRSGAALRLPAGLRTPASSARTVSGQRSLVAKCLGRIDAGSAPRRREGRRQCDRVDDEEDDAESQPGDIEAEVAPARLPLY